MKRIHRTTLSLVLAAACAPAMAGGARVDTSGLDTTTGLTQRFIVKYRDGSRERTNATGRQHSLDAAATRARPQVTAAGGRNNKAATLGLRSLRATARGGMHVVKASRALDHAGAEAVMRALAADPNVEYVAVDAMMQPMALPNDPVLVSHQAWHYGDTTGGARVTTAWEASTGAGVVVAVVDTGVTAHADLVDNLLPGYDFISDAFIARRATDDRVPGGWDLGNWNLAGECGAGSAPRNSNWHGTHVSGTIAETTNNAIGGAGVAYDARVVPVRVLGRCGGLTSDVADAIVWAAGGSVSGIPVNENPAEVINLSLGSAQACPEVMQDAIDAAVALGSTVVVAAGNSNADAANHSPASCNNVVNVASTGYSGTRASYSNYGASIDLSAPGGGGTEGVPNGYIWSTHNTGTTTPGGDQYVGMTGTSMAAPHVAGVVALMQSIAAEPLSPSVVEGLLVASARAFPTAPSATRPIGSGILDAAAAVERARKYGQPDEPIDAAPLTSGMTESMPPLAASEQQMYYIDVPAGKTRLELLTYSGRGTLRAYANYEAEPTPTANVASSLRPGTNQTLVINAPSAGRYYFKVVAVAASAGVRIRARVL